jgi:hypothetical protein
MKTDTININEYPLTTNRLVVNYDREAFFSQYAIVSYYGFGKNNKNLAYEQLADVPCLSITGIRARWTDRPSIRFFVMVKRGKEQDVIQSLRQYEQIRCHVDSLDDYNGTLQKRIIASLAINSLGMARKDRMMYSNGCLILCDDKNFLVPASRKELVCLKIQVNEYMILTAKTTSFSHPKRIEDLKKYCNSVFQIAKDVEGSLWEGHALKPVVVRNLNKKDINLNDFFIQKKRFADNHNSVKYWPYNTENYIHGKLFAISQVMELVNKIFTGVVSVSFKDYEICRYDEYKSKDDMLASLCEYMNGRTIVVEDPFNTVDSKKMIEQMITEMQSVVGGVLSFSSQPSTNAMLIKLCAPKEFEERQHHYTQSLGRFVYNGFALQHKIFSGNEKEDTVSPAEARRILLELMVKDCLVNQRIPVSLAKLPQGWKFTRYKINEGGVLGASATISADGILDIHDFGFSGFTDDFESFVNNELHYSHPERLAGTRDYMAMEKDGNTYLIIDTEEVPVLDAKAIDEAYDMIYNGEVPLAVFKRKTVAHKYLRGYIGMHLWKTEGLDGEPDASYSYIAGKNRDIQIKQNTNMDKLPRARRIFVLNSEKPDHIESDITDIVDMLKLGLGRWNEIMTYPYPFKFLQEYLDNLSEQAFSKHWSEITFKGAL